MQGRPPDGAPAKGVFPAGTGVSGEHGPAAGARPPTGLGFVQVAFAGHNRPADLGDPGALAARLGEVFRLLAEAGVGEARLLTGLAEGADVIAALAWRQVGLGPVHAVYPFLDDRPGAEGEGLAELASWLDGAAIVAEGRNPHLAQTRWILGAADLLVAVWSGEHGRGAGGTADAVRLALEHGAPVIWVQPGDQRLRLIQPRRLHEDYGFLEFIETLQGEGTPLVEPATAEGLREALDEVGVGQHALPPEPHAERARDCRRARIYRWFRRTLGGLGPAAEILAPPPDLAAQPGFVRLSAALEAADARANQLGSLHRSHQVILLGLAVGAAIVGSAPGLWPAAKVVSVAGELLLAMIALLIWRDSERGHSHQRWAVARRLAEDLRLERVGFTIGMPSPRQGLIVHGAEDAARERRLAGLPTGAFDPDRVRRWGRWAIDELMGGQAAYHRRQGAINARISHRVHLVENISFAALLMTLVAYLLALGAGRMLGHEPPHWLEGLVFMASAIVPAIGAAGLALEATLSLGEEAQRSDVLAARLEVLASGLAPEPSLPALQNAAGAAIRLQRAQEDHWLEGAIRRKLVRGG